jgi:hypothetical protein
MRGLSPNFQIHVSVPGSVHILPAADKADRSWKYINRSQTYECKKCANPFLGIFVSNFRYWFFAVWHKRDEADRDDGGAQRGHWPELTCILDLATGYWEAGGGARVHER